MIAVGFELDAQSGIGSAKELAYSAQQHLQASTGGSFKRSHVYELLAASFGFSSHAAFGVDTVLTELR